MATQKNFLRRSGMDKLLGVIIVGLVLGLVIAKYRKEILAGVVCTISVIILIPLYIISSPLRLFGAYGTWQTKIIREYDRAFFEADNMKKVCKINRKIKRIKMALDEREKKKKAKETQEMLEEAMWVI